MLKLLILLSASGIADAQITLANRDDQAQQTAKADTNGAFEFVNLKPGGTIQEPNINALKAMGPPSKANVKLNVAEGGSANTFQAFLKQQLTAFMAYPDARLRIYNPAAFEVWRQDSKPHNNQASMAQLTPTEITRIVTEIGIVLQGRKYGLGCLVSTQRTANVTKTILNRCNSVFALRVFDAKGMEFFRNYVGDDHSAVLSSLENRDAAIFGRASSCSDPVLVRLNDRETTLKQFILRSVCRYS